MTTILIFQSSEKTELNSELVCYANSEDEIFIEISYEDCPSAHICLDKQTAIKLSKVLKSEISKI